ncbi:MAG: hypothetical protein NT076_01695 [Candidatus Pacearchaeota archaeon]|nr:hypothetical protein [Candidatus Pacearchaeota archaeon]
MAKKQDKERETEGWRIYSPIDLDRSGVVIKYDPSNNLLRHGILVTYTGDNSLK